MNAKHEIMSEVCFCAFSYLMIFDFHFLLIKHFLLGGKDDFCHFGDKKYKVGEQYVSQDCTGMCTCLGAKGHSCVSLCPPSFVICKSYEKEVEEKSEPFPGTNCSCNIPKCVPVGMNLLCLFLLHSFDVSSIIYKLLSIATKL